VDIFTLILIVLPIVSLITGVVGYLIFKNIYISAVMVFTVSVITTYAIFNETFLVWGVVYTLLAFLSSLVMKLFFSKRCFRKDCGL
jgi:hypothetical protein